MIQQLSVQNFALITSLHVNFDNGLTTITGETGAGKSLLLGALGLIIGKRVDTSVIRNSEKKCVVEAHFNIESYKLTSFFEDQDLDYEAVTCIRREILPSGKSRAFINDTPVNVSTLQQLGTKLVDIHSQHQTIELTKTNFQFYLLDALAKTQKELDSFNRGLKQLKIAQKKLVDLQESEVKFKEAYDYNSHLLKELDEAKIEANEQQLLEESLETLGNTEEIQERFNNAIGAIVAENQGAFDQLNFAKQQLQKTVGFSSAFEELYNRMNSLCIELDDLRAAVEQEAEMVESNPEKLTQINDRLQLLYGLQKKHQVSDNESLLTIQQQLQQKVSLTENTQDSILEAQNRVTEIESKLNELADKIHAKREKVLPSLVKKLEKILAQLGMPNATFNVKLERREAFSEHGGDDFEILFSANKGAQFGTLKKVASGGELSRIMLAFKMILADHIQLPTIIFDEIDTGVSGEVAQKMALLLEKMGESQQIFSITHLPQIAAKGKNQFKVYKEDIDNVTQTNLKQLLLEERVHEIAEMIGGKQLTEAAKTHAKALLN